MSNPRSLSDQGVLLFGGDYNPEQWPAAQIPEDLPALEQLGVNTVTLPVFAWGLLQPAKDQFAFGWLDNVLEGLDSRDIGVVLATPTAAQPAWLSAAYPEILPVDRSGRRRRHGARVNYCPTSSVYRDAAAGIADQLAQRYGDHERLRLWHINNEYGPVCFCPSCGEQFRRWLRTRHGDLDRLNEAWGTAVWGHTIGDWAEIELPSDLTSMTLSAGGWAREAVNPSIALDHARYSSAVLLECYLNEKAVLRQRTPEVPITTNFHGPVSVVDWHEWGPHLDVISWDSYPAPGDHWAKAAFGHDLARGAGQDRDFLLMEAAPGAVNWQPLCPVKRPGAVRREALQAIARGSRGALYFQVRQARAGQELNHAALIPRHGRLDTRMGRELQTLAADLDVIGVLPDSHTLQARVALIFDWPSWWALDATAGLDQKARYIDTVRAAHQVLAERHELADVVGSSDDWSGYDVVIAPLWYVVEPGTAAAVDAYVAGGGTFITTTGTGISGPDGRIHIGGLEPTLARVLGIWIEETDVQPGDVINRVAFSDDGSTVAARELFDVVRLDTATALATFQNDFYAGSPAVTLNLHGQGRAVHIASISTELLGAVIDRFLPAPVTDAGSTSAAAVTTPTGVEQVEWRSGAGDITFFINHDGVSARLRLPDGVWTDVLADSELGSEFELAPGAVIVARRQP